MVCDALKGSCNQVQWRQNKKGHLEVVQDEQINVEEAIFYHLLEQLSLF